MSFRADERKKKKYQTCVAFDVCICVDWCVKLRDTIVLNSNDDYNNNQHNIQNKLIYGVEAIKENDVVVIILYGQNRANNNGALEPE